MPFEKLTIGMRKKKVYETKFGEHVFILFKLDRPQMVAHRYVSIHCL
jgi:hypothetical protein